MATPGPPPPPPHTAKKLKTSKVRLLKSSASKCGYFIVFDYPEALGRKRDLSPFTMTEVEMNENEVSAFSNSEARALINPLKKAGFFRLRQGHDKALFTWMRHVGDRDHEWVALRPWQMMNHLPCGQLLSHKQVLAEKLQHHHKLFPSAYNFSPETYVMPQQMERFKEVSRAEPKTTWIMKPYASSRGRGIKILSSLEAILAEVTREPEEMSYVQRQIAKRVNRRKVHLPSEVVLQRYVRNPHLIDGLKYDLRIYVLATSFDPLCVYLFKEGLGRFCTTKYNAAAGLDDHFAHLTNSSINKFSKEYECNTGTTAEEMGKGSKRTYTSVLRTLAAMGEDVQKAQARLEALIIKTLIVISGDSHKKAKTVNFDRSRGFEFYGFDVMFTDKLEPTLIEVNFMPDICGFMPMDKIIKGVLIADVLSLAGVQPPPSALKRAGLDTAASKATCSTAEAFVNEVREAELRKGDFTRIFPVRETAAQYIPFFTCKDMRDELEKIVPLLPASAGATPGSAPATTATTATTAAAAAASDSGADTGDKSGSD